MRVLRIVSSPFTHGPRDYRLSRALIKAGHDVTAVAWATQGSHALNENWDGIDIHRVRSPWYAKPLAKDLFRLPSFWRRAYGKAVELHREKGFDLVQCRELDTLLVGVRLKKRFGLKLIYDSHDIYPYLLAAAFPRWIANMAIPVEKRLVRNVDRIFVTAETHKQYFEGIGDRPVSVVMNCKELLGTEYQAPPAGRPFTVLYVGTLSRARYLLELVDVVSQLRDVRCLIGGIGVASYARAVGDRCSRVPNADFVGVVPFDGVIPMTREADVVFLMIDPSIPNDSISLANKQFEAMVCGRPIICSRGTYSGQLTEQEETGLVIEHSKEALRQAIVSLRDNAELRERLGRNALKAAVTKYNWAQEEQKYLAVYEELAAELRLPSTR